MPEIVTSQTRGYVNVVNKSSSQPINGKYTANLPYSKIIAFAPPSQVVANLNNFGELFDARSGLYLADPITDQTSNRLYGKLKERVSGPQGALLTTAVEWKSSLDMISGRTEQLLAAYRAVRKLKLKKAASILKIGMPHRVKDLDGNLSKAKKTSATSIWLEYWMGWAPLHGDIANAIETLEKGPETQKVHFSVAVPQVKTTNETQFGITNPKIGAFYRYVNLLEKKQIFSAYGDMIVTNHNYRLANQLGFSNPALTAWEIVPFSFIIDWFANVGQVLGALTDFQGVEFSNTGQGMKSVVSGSKDWLEYDTEYYYAYPGQWPRAERLRLRTKMQGAVHSEQWRRTPGALPTPRINIVPLDRLSLTRAATSVSLLTEIFLRK